MGPQVHNEERSSGEQVLTVNRFAAIVATVLGILLALLPAFVIYTQASNQFAILSHTVNQLQEGVAEQNDDRREYRRDIDNRLRLVEDRVSRSQQDLSNALATWTRIDARLQRLEERLLDGTGTDSRTPR